jgi:hypothetical protein
VLIYSASYCDYLDFHCTLQLLDVDCPSLPQVLEAYYVLNYILYWKVMKLVMNEDIVFLVLLGIKVMDLYFVKTCISL